MSKENKFLEIVLLLILIGMIVFPFFIKRENPGFVEIYIEDHSNLPKLSDSEFLFSFTIKNNFERDINLNYIFGMETSDSKEIIDLGQASIRSKEKSTFYYPLNRTKKLTRYFVELPQTDQKIHFWVATETINYFLIDEGLPWEMQDPLIREYYRYG